MLVGYGGVAGRLFAHACWLWGRGCDRSDGRTDGLMVGQTRILCTTRNNWGSLRLAPITLGLILLFSLSSSVEKFQQTLIVLTDSEYSRIIEPTSADPKTTKKS